MFVLLVMITCYLVLYMFQHFHAGLIHYFTEVAEAVPFVPCLVIALVPLAGLSPRSIRPAHV